MTGATIFQSHNSQNQKSIANEKHQSNADRCLAVDSEGKLVDGDKILYVCGKYMKEQGTLVNNTVVTTVMSNFGLYKEQKIVYSKIRAEFINRYTD